MTSVRLSRKTDGSFSSCRAEGHAGFAVRGSDIVCAAVTVLLRTAAQVVSETEGVVLIEEKNERGMFSFGVEVKDKLPGVISRLNCVGDFLEDGLCSLQKEFPGNVILRVKTEAF